LAKTTNSDINKEIDPELERLKQKSTQGAMNIFGDILDNPEIKKAVMRKIAMPLIAVACLFIGVLGLFDVAKQLLGLGWQLEIAVSTVLVLNGLIYLLKNMLFGKKHAD